MGSFISNKTRNYESNDSNSIILPKNKSKNNKYTSREFLIIGLTIGIVILGFIIRTWRILREGNPITFDGYYYLRYLKRDFFQGWIDLTALTRDPPGFTFIILIAENLFGYSGQPMMWSLYVFPQIVASVQLLVFFVLARRLTKSRVTALLFMLYMSIIGLFVYRNQNIAPETIVLGLVPFVVMYLLRYLETNDYRYLILSLGITLGVVLVHHLTTMIVLVIWHIILPYDIIYRRRENSSSKKLKKRLVFDIIILILLDVLILLFWQFVLKGFPMNFISDSVLNLFPPGEAIWPTISIILAVLCLNVITFSVFFYNFTVKKINSLIIAVGIIGVIVLFFVAMFFGLSSPDQSIVAGLLMGIHALVYAPLGSFGLTKISEKESISGRTIRGWLFGIILIISVTAIFPNMSSLLGRLALYAISIGGLLATIGIVALVKRANKRKFKAVVLILLSGSMVMTLAYSHPKPEYNWGTQEIFWEAEFSSAIFILNYGNIPKNTIWNASTEVEVETDFRLGCIIEGYLGINSLYEYEIQNSWLKNVIFANSTYLEYFVVNINPLALNAKADFVLISKVMVEDGFITGWAIYGNENNDFVRKFPNVSEFLPLNPFMNRVLDNEISMLLVPKYLTLY